MSRGRTPEDSYRDAYDREYIRAQAAADARRDAKADRLRLKRQHERQGCIGCLGLALVVLIYLMGDCGRARNDLPRADPPAAQIGSPDRADIQPEKLPVATIDQAEVAGLAVDVAFACYVDDPTTSSRKLLFMPTVRTVGYQHLAKDWSDGAGPALSGSDGRAVPRIRGVAMLDLIAPKNGQVLLIFDDPRKAAGDYVLTLPQSRSEAAAIKFRVPVKVLIPFERIEEQAKRFDARQAASTPLNPLTPPAALAPLPREVPPPITLVPRNGRLTLAASPADLAEYEAVWWRASPRGQDLIDAGRVIVLKTTAEASVLDKTAAWALVVGNFGGPRRQMYCHPDCVPK